MDLCHLKDLAFGSGDFLSFLAGTEQTPRNQEGRDIVQQSSLTFLHHLLLIVISCWVEQDLTLSFLGLKGKTV